MKLDEDQLTKLVDNFKDRYDLFLPLDYLKAYFFAQQERASGKNKEKYNRLFQLFKNTQAKLAKVVIKSVVSGKIINIFDSSIYQVHNIYGFINSFADEDTRLSSIASRKLVNYFNNCVYGNNVYKVLADICLIRYDDSNTDKPYEYILDDAVFDDNCIDKGRVENLLNNNPPKTYVDEFIFNVYTKSKSSKNNKEFIYRSDVYIFFNVDL